MIPLDGPTGGVIANDQTLTAADTSIQIVRGNALTVQFKLIGFMQVEQGFSHQIGDITDFPLNHIIGETFDHIRYNPVTVMHDAGGHLDGRRTQQPIFQCVDSGFDPADTRQRQS